MNLNLFLIVLLSLLTFLGVILVYLLLKKNQLFKAEGSDYRTALQLFQKEIHNLSALVHARLQESNQSIVQTNSAIGERLDNSARAYTAVLNKLNQLEEAHKRIYEVGKDISSLQEILQAPKLRGALGELFLGDLLAQILPAKHYALQYMFKNGQIVDAAVTLRDEWIVPIDAKFPLENFKKMTHASDDAAREALRKQFLSDVKKHIDKIASSYILPAEHTLDFALMYIPAENVYYEIIIKGYEGRGDSNLIDLAYQKKVVPVSPNTLYIFLQTILIGLKGLQIEKSTKEILNHVLHLQKDFAKLSANFELLGTHLSRAKNSYDASYKHVERFGGVITSLEGDARSQKLIDAPDSSSAP